MKLNLSSLSKALNSLNAALEEYTKSKTDFLRDACIYRFMYTYELSYKILKRYLKKTEPASNLIDDLTFSSLIRKSNQKGLLLNSWDKWRIYREARNNISHAYDEVVVKELFVAIPIFYKEASYLYQKLKS